MAKSNFLISVRNAEGSNVEPPYFGNEPGPTLYLEVPDGVDPHPEEHRLDRDVWLKKVLKRAEAGKHSERHPLKGYSYGDILIFVHGYNNAISDITARHDLLQKNLSKKGFNGAIISYDWPSAEATLNYLEDRSDAKATASRLVKDGIAILAKNQLEQEENKCDIDVHLLGHSTGAYVIREGFYEARQHRTISRGNWHVSQIMLIGGDIARKSLSRDDSKSQALFTHAARITNYQNPFDSALKISNVKRLGMAPRVGRVGLPDDAPGNIVNINVGDHWEGLNEKDSEAKGNWSHSWHFGDPHFSEDLLHTIQGDIDRHKIPTRTVVNGELTLRPKKRAPTRKTVKKKAVNKKAVNKKANRR